MGKRHLWRGEWIEDSVLYHNLSEGLTYEAIAREPLDPECLYGAIEKLKDIWEKEVTINEELFDPFDGLTKMQKDYYGKMMDELLDSDKWRDKRENEVGSHAIENGVCCQFHPFGVLLHIGAGNEVALSAYSVIEGLLAGNVNIVKVPSYEAGVSMRLLQALAQVEEKLKPYIYVLDIPSEEFATLMPLVDLVDAVVLWGSMSLMQTMRRELPPELPIIEWGHKISFAYMSAKRFQIVLEDREVEGEVKTESKVNNDDSDTRYSGNAQNISIIDNVVKDIHISGQNHCSSPLTLFVESEDQEALEWFAQELAESIERSRQGDRRDNTLDDGVRALQRMTRRMHGILGREKDFYGPRGYGCVRFMHRIPFDEIPSEGTIVLVPMLRGELIKRLSPYRRFFQTVGLEALEEERQALQRLFMGLGATRICPWGAMSSHRLSYPHDGYLSIGRMGRWIVIEE